MAVTGDPYSPFDHIGHPAPKFPAGGPVSAELEMPTRPVRSLAVGGRPVADHGGGFSGGGSATRCTTSGMTPPKSREPVPRFMTPGLIRALRIMAARKVMSGGGGAEVIRRSAGRRGRRSDIARRDGGGLKSPGDDVWVYALSSYRSRDVGGGCHRGAESG